jgi:hypothetical protein
MPTFRSLISSRYRVGEEIYGAFMAGEETARLSCYCEAFYCDASSVLRQSQMRGQQNPKQISLRAIKKLE